MSRNRLMLLLATVAALAIAAGGFFLGVRPQLDRAAAADADRTSVEASNQTTRTEIARLRAQAESLPKMRAQLAALHASVPASASASSFISQLNATADGTGVKVSTITVGDAQAYTPPTAATSGTGEPASTDASATASPSATPTPTPSADPTASAPAAATDSSITAQNFSVIPVSVSVNGEFAQALAFVKGVQANPRLFLIDSISSSIETSASADAATAEAPSWTFSGSIYVLSDSGGKAASAAATNG